MKRVTAHVNTIRVHWLVEELQNNGIDELIVTEYFRPNCQISKLEFYCDDGKVVNITGIIHKIGTNGASVDHTIDLKDTGNDVKSIFPFI